MQKAGGAMLRVSGLTKRYGMSMAIDGISFSADRGEIVGLVGHNGCGKSTTMNIITGYLAATSGTVTVEGEDHVRCAASVRRKIGYMPEVPTLYTDMTVEEQLRFACALKGVKDRSAAIAKACAKADIGGVRGRLIRNMSKGYRQRIGLAQALLGDPPILILDEPTSGLDPQQMAEMRALIRELGRDHLVLMSSHLLTEVAAVCTRVIVISNGLLVADASPEQLQNAQTEEDLYQLRAVGERERLEALIQPCIGEMTLLSEGAQGEKHYRLRTDAPERVWRAIMDDADCRLIACGPYKPDLEEIVLTLTRDRRYGG